ncbi:MAG: hypothetical protein EP329_01020, partial [Deltaproteobacteria bacterium]
MDPARRLLLLALAIALTASAGCASAPPLAAMEDVETLRAERDEWRGERSGAVMLRRHVQTVVGTAQS